MFLKRLEIAGFKSFPDKVKLDFPAGITAVVGPNGSGKSNIADAVRWVMGEQSVKTLRGAKMEDVIFAGTQHRKPLGYAEVHMHLDNTVNLLPIEFSEVKVTRRVYRSGESEYRINGSQCRMKDVHRLFMDTGVGKEGYSIIGQGKVDEILSTRSEDRRHLFEEAAGIVKYKSRRHEAFLKLEREKQNLARVEDLIEELSAQLEPLAQQAEQARIYLDLRERYKTLHINVFLEGAAETEKQVQKYKENLGNILSQSKDKEQQIADVQEALECLKREESEAEEKYKESNRLIIQQVRAIEQAESKLKLRSAKQEYNQANVDRINKDLEKYSVAIAQKEAEQKQEEAACAELQKELTVASQVLQEKEAAYAKVESDLQKAQSVRQELHTAISQHKLLVEMERDHEGYYASVKAVLRKKNADTAFGKGIFGTAGELVSVPEIYETAISVTLAGAAQNIVCATQEDAKRAIGYLKSAKAGRATFLPVSAMKARTVTSEMEKLQNEPGVIGIASSLISFDPMYSPVFGYLLGNVFVVETLTRAIELSKKYRQVYRLVTLEGDLISPGGAMSGGSQNRQSTGIFGRSRQIKELEERISHLQAQSDKQQADGQQLREEARAQLTNHMVNISNLRQLLQTAHDNIDRIKREAQAIKKDKSALESELTALSEGSSYSEQDAEDEIKIMQSDLEKLQKELSATEDNITRLKEAANRAEAEYRETMEALARLNRESARLEARHEQTEAENRRLHNEIWDTYGLTYQGALEFRNPELKGSALRQEERRIKFQIADLGAVNVGAIEAYQAIRQRHDFLSAQRDDIQQAEGQLQEIIQELTEQMEQQFIVQFKLIAKHFNDVFQEMFGGGKADLKMSDPDNVLESGIEITAQPPGKNLQSLSLLSGGERALTAIALLFGILRMKPSPFCILDEIEASLDDANVVRFAKFLKGHAGDTQFIVITHRKGTMECADTLYGVTMQELGISKMVSVDFR